MSGNRDDIRRKVALLELARRLRNVSRACETLGYSRDSYYRFRRLWEAGGEAALAEPSRQRPNPKNRVDPRISDAVVALAFEQPTWGQDRVAAVLTERGLPVSPFGVRGIWRRHELETGARRLEALCARVAHEGLVPTEAQAAALAGRKEVRGAGECVGPGECVFQDVLYLGGSRAVGRIYLQTAIDAYSKLAFAQVSERRTGAAAVGLLRDRVAPFFASTGVAIVRVVTPGGSEFRGMPDHDEYERHLALTGIAYARTRGRGPRGLGPSAAFHDLILGEFFRPILLKRGYGTSRDLRLPLDTWLKRYCEDRAYEGRWCFGRTPLQTYRDTLCTAHEKRGRDA